MHDPQRVPAPPDLLNAHLVAALCAPDLNAGRLAAWWAPAATAAGVPTDVMFTEITRKNRILRGDMAERARGQYTAWHFGEVLVLDDGRISRIAPAGPVKAPRRELNGGTLSGGDLVGMAEKLGYALTLR